MLCQCGCGLETELSDRTITALGRRRGDPLQFRRGHAGGMGSARTSITPDMWTEQDRGHETPCWIWNRPPKSQWGHCTITMAGKEHGAHRAMYEQEVGPIPEGLEIDHLCHQPSCIRPDHLEPVTHAENIRRSPLAKLNHEKAAFIRTSSLSRKELAAMFGVCGHTITRVQTGRTWA